MPSPAAAVVAAAVRCGKLLGQLSNTYARVYAFSHIVTAVLQLGATCSAAQRIPANSTSKTNQRLAANPQSRPAATQLCPEPSPSLPSTILICPASFFEQLEVPFFPSRAAQFHLVPTLHTRNSTASKEVSSSREYILDISDRYSRA